MKKETVLLMIVLFCSGLSFAQSLSEVDSLILRGKEQMQQAIDSWDEEQMLAARGLFERLLSDPTYPWLVHYYIGYIDRPIVHFYLSKKNKDKAKEFVNDGIQHLEKSVELKEDFAEGYALLNSLFGSKIGLNPLLGMTLGPKSGRMLEKAFALEPENPRISLIAGQSAYYKPKMFGGGKDKALRHIEKAIECFQTFVPDKPVDPAWGHAEAYAYMGLIQMDRKDYMGAEQSFEKALEIHPNYGWIKYNLMKKLKAKMAQEDKE